MPALFATDRTTRLSSLGTLPTLGGSSQIALTSTSLKLFFIMRTFYAQTVVQEDGKLTLDHLPFAQGDSLQVFIAACNPVSSERYPLRGTVLKYERPLDPVAEEDWAAAK